VEVYQAEQRSLIAGDQLRWTRNERISERREAFSGECAHDAAKHAGAVPPSKPAMDMAPSSWMSPAWHSRL